MSLAPGKIVKDCDRILAGEFKFDTPEEFQRWTVIQIRRLAMSLSSRYRENKSISRRVDDVGRVVSGGLGMKK